MTNADGSSPRAWGTRKRPPRRPHRARFIPTGVGNTGGRSCGRRRRPVHPHGRGEHLGQAVFQRVGHGSSPRAWGTRPRFRGSDSRCRFIPTGVGNTPTRHSRARSTAVHPHGRGEHTTLDVRDRVTTGSSPRAWGTLFQPDAEPKIARFIPTGVGNTGASWGAPPAIAVHPHGRGEHTSTPCAPAPATGSSPRAWGTRVSGRTAGGTHRFIPTGVGNTNILWRRHLWSSVHPHGRGEHSSTRTRRHRWRGSSPRAWGTRVARHGIKHPLRFIPTGVGNTTCRSAKSMMLPVHPHGRGEHKQLGVLDDAELGSSPRAWGTRADHLQRAGRRRFIPTGVGNTSRTTPPPADETVHPHGRGEHAKNRSLELPDAGSSPRAWGTPAWPDRPGRLRGFIPTGVGNTSTVARSLRTKAVHPHGRGEHERDGGEDEHGVGSSPRAWGTHFLYLHEKQWKFIRSKFYRLQLMP